MNNIADLHVHTTYSDGTLTPSELVLKAKEAGLSAVAITDHDTVDGIEKALLAGKQQGITVVPGIELSAHINGKEIHLLSYYFDWTNEELRQLLQKFREERLKRAEHIIQKLNKMKLPVTLDHVLELAGDGVVARPHIARALVERGLVSSYRQVFDEYIGDDRPAYVKKFEFSVKEAIGLVRKAGGITSLAHPGHNVSEEELLQLIRAGIDGIEVVHPSHSEQETQFYHGIATEYYLLETGGSDYHGGMKESDQLFGKVYVSCSVLDAMRHRLQAS